MLVLSRRRSEGIVIEGAIVTVLEIRGDKVRLGIEAPAEYLVGRRELVEHKLREQKLSAGAESEMVETVLRASGPRPLEPGAVRQASPPFPQSGTGPGGSPVPSNFRTLQRNLFDGSPDARESAARELGSLFAHSPAAEVLTALVAALKNEREPAVSAALADSIRALGGKSLLPESPRAVGDTDSEGGSVHRPDTLSSRETALTPAGASRTTGRRDPRGVSERQRRFEAHIQPVVATLPEDPDERLAAVADLYGAVRKQSALALRPAVTSLLRDCSSLSHDQKAALSRRVNQVLLDARLAILNPNTGLPAKLEVHRSRPSSKVSTLRLQDSRQSSDGRIHRLRIQDLELVGAGVQLVDTSSSPDGMLAPCTPPDPIQ
jgi:carbon storage regulator